MAQGLDAGLLVYRVHHLAEILLIRPGGPLWSRKDNGSWSIPKGSVTPGDPLASIRQQFTFETGLAVEGDFTALAPLEEKGGKVLQAYAVECDLDLADFRTMDYELEWPPGSGRLKRFPEIEDIRYFDVRSALRKLIPPQWPLLLQAAETLAWAVERRGPFRETR
jgi:predicted NUDIX family NTP pyrophosphohydrolase